jgi:hypothetical protein
MKVFDNHKVSAYIGRVCPSYKNIGRMKAMTFRSIVNTSMPLFGRKQCFTYMRTLLTLYSIGYGCYPMANSVDPDQAVRPCRPIMTCTVGF